MANDADIKIGLATTGDTSGAEEVRDAIFEVEDAAQEAQRQADVDAVKAKQAAAVQREQAAALREVADGQQRIIAANLAQAVGEISKQFKGMSPEIDMALESGQNFLSVLASTGNPITASLALVGTAIGAVSQAYRQAAEDGKLLAKEEEAHLKKISELRALYAQQIREERLVEVFARELSELDKHEKALQRISKIRASERSLAAAQQQAASAAGVRAGDDPKFAAARDSVVATENQIDEINAKLQDQRQAVDTAQAKADALATAASTLIQTQGEGADSAIKAAAAAKEAAAAAEEAQLDLAASMEIAQNQSKEVVATGAEKISANANDAFEAASTKNAEEIKALIEGIREAQNGTLTEPAKQALVKSNELLADNKVTIDEAGKLEALVRQFASSREAASQQTQAYLNSIISNEQQLIAALQSYGSRIGGLQMQINALSARIR